MVYCEKCRYYKKYGNGSERCKEIHAVINSPLFPPGDTPKDRNANHDCKDYEAKEIKNDR
jgi:hypothetical protein